MGFNGLAAAREALPKQHGILLQDWKRWQQTRRFAASTIEEHLRVVRLFGVQAAVEPIHATHDDIMDWIVARDDLSDASVNKYLSHLRCFYTWAQRFDHRLDNPLVKIDAPKIPYVEVSPISDAGIVRLMTVRTHYRTRVMILLMALAGLRAHEVAKVKGEDFDLDTKRLRVLGKGRKECTIRLNPVLVSIAAVMPRRGYWFEGVENGHIRSDSVSANISAAMRRAGVTGRPHGLRSWYATTLLDNGANLIDVQNALRHSLIQTTQRYAATSQPRVNAAIDELDVYRARRHDRQSLLPKPFESDTEPYPGQEDQRP